MAGKMDQEMFEGEVLRQALGRTGECPPVEALSSEMQRTPKDPGRKAVELHLDECFHCRTELHLLREFESGSVRPDEKDAVKWISGRLGQTQAKPSAAVRWWRYAGTLALWKPQVLAGFGATAAVAVIAIVLLVPHAAQDRREGNVPEFSSEIQRSQTVEIIPASGVFQWKPVPNAAQYELTVRAVDNAVVFHNTFTTPTLAFPPEVVKTVSTGKLLLWDVVAHDSAGNAIARSGVQRLRQSPR